jgi:hypothetical protein
VNVDLDEPRLARPAHDAVVERSREEIWKDRYYVELHQ